MKKFLKIVMVAGIAAAVAHLVSLHKKRKKMIRLGHDILR
jgi:hypothetical protein